MRTETISKFFDAPAALACAACGQCCKALPGQFIPADLGAAEPDRTAKARDLLLSGNYSIDWWEGDIDGHDEMSVIYFLRPSTVAAQGKIFDPSWGGQCIMLGENGCTLTREDRPFVCKALVPTHPNCHGMSKHDVAVAWRADSNWLGDLGNEVAAAQDEA